MKSTDLQAELDALVTFGRKCQGLVLACAKLVDQYEAHAQESSRQIERLSEALVLEKTKPRLKFLYFVPPFVLGLVLGIIIR